MIFQSTLVILCLNIQSIVKYNRLSPRIIVTSSYHDGLDLNGLFVLDITH